MRNEEPEELDEPLDELRSLALEPEPGFRLRLRRRLERRRLAGSTLDLAPALVEVLKELLDFVFARGKGDSK